MQNALNFQFLATSKLTPNDLNFPIFPLLAKDYIGCQEPITQGRGIPLLLVGLFLPFFPLYFQDLAWFRRTKYQRTNHLRTKDLIIIYTQKINAIFLPNSHYSLSSHHHYSQDALANPFPHITIILFPHFTSLKGYLSKIKLLS